MSLAAYRSRSLLAELSFFLQLLIELATRSILKDKIDSGTVVEIPKETKNMWMSRRKEESW